MARFIMQPANGMVVDHIDHNGLNNQRSNLRVCTQMQNMANKRISKDKVTSAYKGVYPCAKRKWQVRIEKDGKDRHLGVFATPEEAALAYNAAALEAWGEYAFLNEVGAIPDVYRYKVVPSRQRGASGYRGVVLVRRPGRWWVARLAYRGKTLHIGYFADPVEAAKAYDQKARELLGDLATVNFPIEETQT
jgi:hypothetical protein